MSDEQPTVRTFQRPQRPPIVESNLDARTVEESFRVVDEMLQLPSSGSRLQVLARLVGGAFIRSQLPASSSAEASADAVIPHQLGRMPTAVMMAVDCDGLGGQVLGAARGGIGASGGNAGAWSATHIRLRATRAGCFELVVV